MTSQNEEAEELRIFFERDENSNPESVIRLCFTLFIRHRDSIRSVYPALYPDTETLSGPSLSGHSYSIRSVYPLSLSNIETLSVYPSIRLSTEKESCLSVYPSIRLSIYPFTRLSSSRRGFHPD